MKRRCIWKLTARARVWRSRVRVAFSRRLLRYSRPTLSIGRWRSTSAQFVDVAEELALIGADGFAEEFVVVEDCPEAEGKYGGMLKAIRDDPGVVDTSLLVEGFVRIVLAYDDGEVTCGIEKHLIAAYSKDGFKRYRLAMTG
jgi:hypothetical protein